MAGCSTAGAALGLQTKTGRKGVVTQVAADSFLGRSPEFRLSLGRREGRGKLTRKDNRDHQSLICSEHPTCQTLG
jgi:hypothetical protein